MLVLLRSPPKSRLPGRGSRPAVTCVQRDPAGYGGGVEGQRDVPPVQVHATHAAQQVLVGGEGVRVVLGHRAVRGLGDLAGC